jgi:peptidoglycan/LPS O-acetylase OafA/YrhL
MARTSRKRRTSRRPDFQPPGRQPRPAEGGRPASGAARGSSQRPAAPWGSFPLSEIVILIAIVLLVGGFFVDAPRGPVMIAAGLALGSLAGLELSLREHLAGYRSHTLLLAGAVGVAVFGVMFVFAPDQVPPLARVAAGLLAFGLAAWGLTGLFRRRSGGALFKTRP